MRRARDGVVSEDDDVLASRARATAVGARAAGVERVLANRTELVARFGDAHAYLRELDKARA